jgi:hypothetical protein
MPPQQRYRRRVDRRVQSPQSDTRMLVLYPGKLAGTFRQDYSFEGVERRKEEKARPSNGDAMPLTVANRGLGSLIAVHPGRFGAPVQTITSRDFFFPSTEVKIRCSF